MTTLRLRLIVCVCVCVSSGCCRGIRWLSIVATGYNRG